MKLRVKIDGQLFEVELGDLQERPIKATLDGETFEVWPQEAASEAAGAASVAPPVSAAPAPAPVAAAPQPGGANSLLAPIPGVIVSIEVREGDPVEAGQPVMTLEAMKMKNIIRATRSGKVALLKVTVGETVRHNQPLLEYAG